MISSAVKLYSNKVFLNFFHLAFGGLFTQVIGLITFIQISHLFSPDNYGEYSFLLMQAQLLASIGDLGLRNVNIRAIARDKTESNDIVFNGIGLRLLVIVLLTLLYLMYNYFWGNLTILEVVMVSCYCSAICLCNLFESVFWANQQMRIPSIINITFALLWLAFIQFWPLQQQSVGIVFFIFLLTNNLKAVAFFLSIKKRGYLVGKIMPLLESFKKSLKEGWPYLGLSLLMLPSLYLPNNFLDINSNSTEIAYANVAQRLINPLSLVMGFVLSAIFPNLSQIWVNDKDKFYKITEKGFTYYIGIGLVICVLFMLFSKPLVVLLFSKEYIAVVRICQLQIWYVLLMTINALITTIWSACDKEKLILRSAFVNAVISTPLLFVGSYWGAIGLSYAYLISFAIFEVYMWINLKRSLSLSFRSARLMWIATGVVFSICYYFAFYSPI